jgi:transcriptional regulator with XRE-family HTH domain
MAKISVKASADALGDYLREQRTDAKLSLRQLAQATGISNPYLSQIERGLRRPSAEVLQKIAKSLQISAETLYIQAGILSPEDHEIRSVEVAIIGDPGLTDRQKQSLVEIYRSFRAANPPMEPALDPEPGPADPVAALLNPTDSPRENLTKEEGTIHG